MKKLTSNKKVPTIKQKEWLKQTVITKNPSLAARMAYNVKDNHMASVMASENLAKPYLREELNKMLEQYDLVLEDTIKEHKWVITQRKDISSKMRGIREHYEVLGLRNKRNYDEKPIRIGLVVYKD